MLAEWTGLEPATPGVTGRYSNQLNYHSKLHIIVVQAHTIALWLLEYTRRSRDLPNVLASPRGFEPLYSP